MYVCMYVCMYLCMYVMYVCIWCIKHEGQVWFATLQYTRLGWNKLFIALQLVYKAQVMQIEPQANFWLHPHPHKSPI